MKDAWDIAVSKDKQMFAFKAIIKGKRYRCSWKPGKEMTLSEFIMFLNEWSLRMGKWLTKLYKEKESKMACKKGKKKSK